MCASSTLVSLILAILILVFQCSIYHIWDFSLDFSHIHRFHPQVYTVVRDYSCASRSHVGRPNRVWENQGSLHQPINKTNIFEMSWTRSQSVCLSFSVMRFSKGQCQPSRVRCPHQEPRLRWLTPTSSTLSLSRWVNCMESLTCSLMNGQFCCLKLQVQQI